MNFWFRFKSILTLILAMALTTAEASEVERSAEYFFPQDRISNVQISPGGDWVVALASGANSSGLLAQRFGSAEVKPIFGGRTKPQSIDWVGRNQLLVKLGEGQIQRYLAVDFKRAGNSGFEFTKRRFHPPGYLIDPLSLVDGQVIWGFEVRGKHSVRQIALNDLMKLRWRTGQRRVSIRFGKVLASLKGNIRKWIVNRKGVPIAAVRQTKDEKENEILYRSGMGEKFHEVARYEFETADLIYPFGLAQDGRKLLVTAYNGHDTIGLFEFDPETQTIEREIYRRDDADIDFVIFDTISRNVQSVSYELGGERHHHYLGLLRSMYTNLLGKEAPSIDLINVVSSTADRQKFVYWTSGSAEPGAYFLRSVSTGETIRIGQNGQNIDRSSLAQSLSFQATASDGIVIEAFLTAKSHSPGEAMPLIVLPHGGPAGVRDSRRFDPLVQYLASWGFAVLQVNYRGSSGYGREFETAGKKQWAKGIEDDIDAAVEYAMGLDWIDSDRICIIGGSYGGFSAVVSVLRHGGRYRCAGTINGVSDIPLLGESSDIADSARVREFYSEWVGDFETERDKLVAISPVYHLEKVSTPILVVYGDADRRVDQDHAHRMIVMLQLYGKEYEEIRVKDGAHSFSREQWIYTLPEIRRFLTKHLMPSVVYSRDPRPAN